jgi:hypothetical protein
MVKVSAKALPIRLRQRAAAREAWRRFMGFLLIQKPIDTTA